MPATVNIGMIGTGFMGRAHSQGWSRATQHFDSNPAPVLHTVCGTRPAATKEFARRWGWQQASTDWQSLVKNPDIHVIDIAAPNDLHAEIALAAVAAGKVVICEKPLGRNVAEVARIVKLAEQRGTPAYVWFNYRQVPAMILARQLIAAGRIGEVRRVRATYLQDWMNRTEDAGGWRMNAAASGGGAALDLLSHSADLVRYLTGSEFVAVCATSRAVGQHGSTKPRGATIDNAVAAIAELSCGATATLEASRCAAGHGNDNSIEINGELGALRFSLPELNHLELWDDSLPAGEKGWRRIATTGGAAPLGRNYWPVDHVIGYGETFVSTAAELLRTIAGTSAGNEPASAQIRSALAGSALAGSSLAGSALAGSALATFTDGLRSLEVVDATMQSARERRWIELDGTRLPPKAAAIEPVARRSMESCESPPAPAFTNPYTACASVDEVW